MFPNFLMPFAEAITNDGGLSADYTLTIAVGLCTALVSVIFGFLLSSINSIKEDVKQIRNEFHGFMVNQVDINSNLKEKTKHL